MRTERVVAYGASPLVQPDASLSTQKPLNAGGGDDRPVGALMPGAVNHLASGLVAPSRTSVLRAAPLQDVASPTVDDLLRMIRSGNDDAFLAALADTGAQSRLPAALALVSGETLLDLFDEMSCAEQQSFRAILGAAGVRPDERARLAADVLDDAIFTGGKGRFVDTLTAGITAQDGERFLKELERRGEIDDFLDPASGWTVFLAIITLGISLLFASNNREARRNLAAAGWDDARIRATFRVHDDGRSLRDAVLGWERDKVASALPASMRPWADVALSILDDKAVEDVRDLPQLLSFVGATVSGAVDGLRDLQHELDSRGATQQERVAAYRELINGLTPAAIEQQLKDGNISGPAATTAKLISAGILRALNAEVQAGTTTWVTPELIEQIGTHDMVNRDTPIVLGDLDDAVLDAAGYTGHPLLSAADWRAVRERMRFFREHTGIDASRVRIYYGDIGKFASMKTGGSYMSISNRSWPLEPDGTLPVTPMFLQILCNHEMAHVWQGAMYGANLSSAIDRLIKTYAADGDESAGGQAYKTGAGELTPDPNPATGKARSLHDFVQHAEKQAELLEWTLELMWKNRAAGRPWDALPTGSPTLPIAPGGGSIPVDAALWDTLVRFVRDEMQDTAANRHRNPQRADGSFPY